MQKRYRALRIISTLYKILGTIVLVSAVLSGIGLCLAGVLGGTAFQAMSEELPPELAGASALIGIFIGVASLVGGAISGLSLFAMGEGIALAIAVEENTRATAMYLAAQNTPVAPAYSPPPYTPPGM